MWDVPEPPVSIYGHLTSEACFPFIRCRNYFINSPTSPNIQINKLDWAHIVPTCAPRHAKQCAFSLVQTNKSGSHHQATTSCNQATMSRHQESGRCHIIPHGANKYSLVVFKLFSMHQNTKKQCPESNHSSYVHRHIIICCTGIC